MAITCQSVLVKKAPANITATNMVSTSYDCIEPCTVNVTIEWTNTGGTAGTFEPAIVVNSVRTGSGNNVTLPPTQKTSYIFTLSNLIEGTFILCPDPN